MPRVLLLLPTTTYRTKAFIDAALKLGVEVVAASEYPSTLVEKNPAGLLTLNLYDPETAARDAAEYSSSYPVDAVIPVDEDTAVAAAHIARAIGLSHNSVDSCLAAKNKLIMRRAQRDAGVPAPRFWNFTLDDDLAAVAAQLTYPCVIKPVFLSTSRGVMRVDDAAQLNVAIRRLRSILERPEVARRGGAARRDVLAEEFIPGFEIALEGLLSNGQLRALAIFDKPDPLDGPFFEETIYVTPSRLSAEMQQRVLQVAGAASRALGLVRGPIHAELRINERGPWIIEVAARAIGGLCSRALRFTGGASLEELIISHALGQHVGSLVREENAAGVMMVPIPRSGILREVRGIDAARQVPGVEDIVISAHINQELKPPPEGAAYLGFIFSRSGDPRDAEAALREAHRRLEFVIE